MCVMCVIGGLVEQYMQYGGSPRRRATSAGAGVMPVCEDSRADHSAHKPPRVGHGRAASRGAVTCRLEGAPACMTVASACNRGCLT